MRLGNKKRSTLSTLSTLMYKMDNYKTDSKKKRDALIAQSLYRSMMSRKVENKG